MPILMNLTKLLLFEDAFVPWQEVDHPVYGKVEIGGFDKNFGRTHPGFLLDRTLTGMPLLHIQCMGDT